LEKADLANYFRPPHDACPGEQLGKIRKFIESGKPLIGLAHRQSCVRKLEGMDRDILGGNYHTITGTTLAAANKSRPETADHPSSKESRGSLPPVDRWYLNAPLHRHQRLLLMGSVTNHRRSLWPGHMSTKGANLLHLAGAPEGLREPFVPAMLVNANLLGVKPPSASRSELEVLRR